MRPGMELNADGIGLAESPCSASIRPLTVCHLCLRLVSESGTQGDVAGPADHVCADARGVTGY